MNYKFHFALAALISLFLTLSLTQAANTIEDTTEYIAEIEAQSQSPGDRLQTATTGHYFEVKTLLELTALD